jgi:hypothetical protein
VTARRKARRFRVRFAQTAQACLRGSAPRPRCAIRCAVPLHADGRGKAKLGRAARREIASAHPHSFQRIRLMQSDTPLAFHRRRISQLSNTIGAWFRCPNASCRRAGACRRADDVFPPCIVPVMRGVNESLMTYLNALPGMPPRKPAESESAHAQIERLNKRRVICWKPRSRELRSGAGSCRPRGSARCDGWRLACYA